jgi:hypothetical protein
MHKPECSLTYLNYLWDENLALGMDEAELSPLFRVHDQGETC